MSNVTVPEMVEICSDESDGVSIKAYGAIIPDVKSKNDKTQARNRPMHIVEELDDDLVIYVFAESAYILDQYKTYRVFTTKSPYNSIKNMQDIIELMNNAKEEIKAKIKVKSDEISAEFEAIKQAKNQAQESN